MSLRRLTASLSQMSAETAAGVMLAGFFLALTGLVMRAVQVLA